MSLSSKVSNILRAVYDARYRYMFWQTRIEDMSKRQQLARAAADKAPKPNAVEEGADPLALIQDGYVVLDDFIAPSEVAEMREYFQQFDSFSPYRPELGRFHSPHDAPPSIHVSNFDEHVALNAPYALKLANDPAVLQTIGAFLGCKPLIGLIHAWWSMPTGQGPQHAENYHRDYDDLKFAKLFIYLTDVDEQSGPHMFVKGSPRSPKLQQRQRYSDSEVSAAFPEISDHMSFTGPAGTAFIEDTSGLHKGVPPVSAPRLIFQVLYTLKPYFGGPAKTIRPAADHERHLDPYTNGVYLTF